MKKLKEGGWEEGRGEGSEVIKGLFFITSPSSVFPTFPCEQKKLTGKDKRFNAPAPEMTSITSSEASKEGRRTAAIIPKDEVALVRKIGEGAHGSVHEGTWADVHGAVSEGGGKEFEVQYRSL